MLLSPFYYSPLASQWSHVRAGICLRAVEIQSDAVPCNGQITVWFFWFSVAAERKNVSSSLPQVSNGSCWVSEGTWGCS